MPRSTASTAGPASSSSTTARSSTTPSPTAPSHELYKGILDGHARGVFNGKIYVRQDAQKTDAKQTNKTPVTVRRRHDQHQTAAGDLPPTT